MTKHYTLLTFVLLCLSIPALAQELPKNLVQVLGGYSKHGSGDMNGIIFGAEYLRYYGKRLSVNYNFRSTINDQKHTYIVTSGAGSHDASIRFTTAGVQLGADAGFSFVRTPVHELMISLGGFLRYQSASNGDDGYATYYPTTTGIPTVLFSLQNLTPQETFNAGGILQLRYMLTFNRKIAAGLSAGFQTDTNADVIPQLGVTIGRRI